MTLIVSAITFLLNRLSFNNDKCKSIYSLLCDHTSSVWDLLKDTSTGPIRRGELTPSLDNERRLFVLYRFHYLTVRVLIQYYICVYVCVVTWTSSVHPRTRCVLKSRVSILRNQNSLLVSKKALLYVLC